LPIAAPAHEGEAAPVMFAPDTFMLKVMTVPSGKVYEKFCPAEERAVVLLYPAKSSQQYVCQLAGPVEPCEVA
jgi:hypothetical protein